MSLVCLLGEMLWGVGSTLQKWLWFIDRRQVVHRLGCCWLKTGDSEEILHCIRRSSHMENFRWPSPYKQTIPPFISNIHDSLSSSLTNWVLDDSCRGRFSSCLFLLNGCIALLRLQREACFFMPSVFKASDFKSFGVHFRLDLHFWLLIMSLSNELINNDWSVILHTLCA